MAVLEELVTEEDVAAAVVAFDKTNSAETKGLYELHQPVARGPLRAALVTYGQRLVERLGADDHDGADPDGGGAMTAAAGNYRTVAPT